MNLIRKLNKLSFKAHYPKTFKIQPQSLRNYIPKNTIPPLHPPPLIPTETSLPLKNVHWIVKRPSQTTSPEHRTFASASKLLGAQFTVTLNSAVASRRASRFFCPEETSRSLALAFRRRCSRPGQTFARKNGARTAMTKRRSFFHPTERHLQSTLHSSPPGTTEAEAPG